MSKSLDNIEELYAANCLLDTLDKINIAFPNIDTLVNKYIYALYLYYRPNY